VGEDREEYTTTYAPTNGTGPHQAPAEATAPITRLSVLDKLFEARGVAKVRVGARLLELPIQAVDAEQVEALCRPYRPRIVVKRERIDGQWQDVRNLADERYQDALTHYNLVYTHVNALCGLCVDIADAAGNIVWAADNSVHNVPAALEALKAMGLVLNHLVSLNQAIMNLTRYEEEQQLGE
jgi:hypothetical protein